jgi:tetratricopeptide (TPR) repeat protein
MGGTTETSNNEAITCKIQGNIFFRQENYEEALLYYEKGLKIDPNYTDIWNNIGQTLVKLGRIEDAKQWKHQMKKFREHPEAIHTRIPAHTGDKSEKQEHSTVKTNGVGDLLNILKPGHNTGSPGMSQEAPDNELRFREIEQNIESIQIGLDQARCGRIEETRKCSLQIKEIEETIELTKQDLEWVKTCRIEETKKVKKIEEHVELTKKGLELIKAGRIEEERKYQMQLGTMEKKIELTRNSLSQVKKGASVTGTGDNQVSTAATPVETGKLSATARPKMVRTGAEGAQQIKDIEDIVGVPEKVEQPPTLSIFRLVILLLILLVLGVLCYVTFFL